MISANNKDKDLISEHHLDNIKYNVLKVFGLVFLIFTCLITISLISYNPADTSFNALNTGHKVTNILGAYGAMTSDILLQTFGLVAYIIPLYFTLWGVRMFVKSKVRFSLLSTLSFLVLSFLSFDILFSFIGTHNFKLIVGLSQLHLGGFIGTLFQKHVFQVIFHLNEKSIYLKETANVFGMVLSGLIGFWSFGKAFGIKQVISKKYNVFYKLGLLNKKERKTNTTHKASPKKSNIQLQLNVHEEKEEETNVPGPAPFIPPSIEEEATDLSHYKDSIIFAPEISQKIIPVKRLGRRTYVQHIPDGELYYDNTNIDIVTPFTKPIVAITAERQNAISQRVQNEINHADYFLGINEMDSISKVQHSFSHYTKHMDSANQTQDQHNIIVSENVPVGHEQDLALRPMDPAIPSKPIADPAMNSSDHNMGVNVQQSGFQPDLNTYMPENLEMNEIVENNNIEVLSVTDVTEQIIPQETVVSTVIKDEIEEEDNSYNQYIAFDDFAPAPTKSISFDNLSSLNINDSLLFDNSTNIFQSISLQEKSYSTFTDEPVEIEVERDENGLKPNPLLDAHYARQQTMEEMSYNALHNEDSIEYQQRQEALRMAEEEDLDSFLDQFTNEILNDSTPEPMPSEAPATPAQHTFNTGNNTQNPDIYVNNEFDGVVDEKKKLSITNEYGQTVISDFTNITEPEHVIQDIVTEPELMVQPEPMFEPTPEPELMVQPEPMFEPAPEPAIIAQPKPMFEPTPEPELIAQPEPMFEPTPEPVVIAQPEPMFEPTPEPVVEMAMDPVSETPKADVIETIGVPMLEYDDYILPNIDLLSDESDEDIIHENEFELREKAQKLENILRDFKVHGEIMNVLPGPIVTLFELEPAPGIKTSKIIGLSNDIARAMGTTSARIATIPGKTVLGIELPNEQRQTVNFKELIKEQSFIEADKNKLPFIIGRDIGGKSKIESLASTPHLLIAGTTGSGKSVGVNALIMSLLYKYTPNELKFILIDPKILELSIYDRIPHLLSPVITDHHKAMDALNWAVEEMDRRYQLMAQVHVRNIAGFNTKIESAKSKGDVLYRTVKTGINRETGKIIEETQELALEKLPYIVIIVDEMADLMMATNKEVEGPVLRIAQKARAAGIHLVISTQRPSVDVITGTIKANFPARISFQVSAKADSTTIIGEPGAEKLLGKGDMLTRTPSTNNRITRYHGPFVTDDEVAQTVDFISAQAEPFYVELKTNTATADVSGAGSNSDDNDELYTDAVNLVLREEKASTSFIQRHFKIGYNRAARMIDIMEADGIVSSPDRIGRRTVLR